MSRIECPQCGGIDLIVDGNNLGDYVEINCSCRECGYKFSFLEEVDTK